MVQSTGKSVMMFIVAALVVLAAAIIVADQYIDDKGPAGSESELVGPEVGDSFPPWHSFYGTSGIPEPPNLTNLWQSGTDVKGTGIYDYDDLEQYVKVLRICGYTVNVTPLFMQVLDGDFLTMYIVYTPIPDIQTQYHLTLYVLPYMG